MRRHLEDKKFSQQLRNFHNLDSIDKKIKTVEKLRHQLRNEIQSRNQSKAMTTSMAQNSFRQQSLDTDREFKQKT